MDCDHIPLLNISPVKRFIVPIIMNKYNYNKLSVSKDKNNNKLMSLLC